MDRLPPKDHDQTRSESMRKIIHVDMDSFFASVEQRDNPDLRGRPIAVGREASRGVVATASYEARKFGVKSAMPSVVAARLCPELVFVPPRFEAYREASAQIREIFDRYSYLVEPLSLDEAYLDVTDNPLNIQYARDIAIAIKRDIKAETRLIASAGVSYNKFLAKLASDHRKPDGLFVIPPGKGADFVKEMEVGRFHGIGPATAEKMRQMGIVTANDLRSRTLEELVAAFGKAGRWHARIAWGEDDRSVNPQRERKSIGAENTFSHDLWSEPELHAELVPLCAKVIAACERHQKWGRTVTLKVKFSDFTQITRQTTSVSTFHKKEEIEMAARRLLSEVTSDDRGIRLLGVSVSGFHDTANSPQLDLPL